MEISSARKLELTLNFETKINWKLKVYYSGKLRKDYRKGIKIETKLN